MSVVENTSALLAHMIIRLQDGSIAENTRRTAKPSKIRLGDGSLSPAFEKNILGLKVGDKVTFSLMAADAFGMPYSENIMDFPESQFTSMDTDSELEVGGLIEFENRNGQIMIGIVRAIKDGQVQIDFNHPLAGQDVEFEIEILMIDE